MSRVKDYWMELDERGFGEIPDNNVCGGCFEDYGMNSFVEHHGRLGRCSYCGCNNDRVCKLEAILRHIVESIRTEWYLPEESGTPYDSEEGEWFAEPIDKQNLFEEDDFGATGQLRDDIIGAIDQEFYLKEFVEPDDDNEMRWGDFKELVLKQSRFLFSTTRRNFEVDNFLSCIGQMVKQFNLVTQLSAGTEVVRARMFYAKDLPATLEKMGPPPYEKTISSRISPAGMVMLYAAGNLDTAIDEILPSEKEIVCYATFSLLQPVYIVDFTKIKKIPVPSIYDINKRNLRYPLRFLRAFLTDFTKPVEKDGREHIDYVPTQLVSEYIKFYITAENGSPVDGISYPCSKGSGVSYAFFVDTDLKRSPRKYDDSKDCLFELIPDSIKTILMTGDRRIEVKLL